MATTEHVNSGFIASTTGQQASSSVSAASVLDEASNQREGGGRLCWIWQNMSTYTPSLDEMLIMRSNTAFSSWMPALPPSLDLIGSAASLTGRTLPLVPHSLPRTTQQMEQVVWPSTTVSKYPTSSERCPRLRPSRFSSLSPPKPGRYSTSLPSRLSLRPPATQNQRRCRRRTVRRLAQQSKEIVPGLERGRFQVVAHRV